MMTVPRRAATLVITHTTLPHLPLTYTCTQYTPHVRFPVGMDEQSEGSGTALNGPNLKMPRGTSNKQQRKIMKEVGRISSLLCYPKGRNRGSSPSFDWTTERDPLLRVLQAKVPVARLVKFVEEVCKTATKHAEELETLRLTQLKLDHEFPADCNPNMLIEDVDGTDYRRSHDREEADYLMNEALSWRFMMESYRELCLCVKEGVESGIDYGDLLVAALAATPVGETPPSFYCASIFFRYSAPCEFQELTDNSRVDGDLLLVALRGNKPGSLCYEADYRRADYLLYPLVDEMLDSAANKVGRQLESSIPNYPRVLVHLVTGYLLGQKGENVRYWQ
jgi:hypothetical protein